MHLPEVATLAFVPLFAIADRWVGWGGNGRAPPMLFAIVAGGVLGYLTLGPHFASVGLFWAAWRSIGFFHNSLAPASYRDIGWTALRYSLQIPTAALAYWSGGIWECLLIWLVMSAAAGVMLRTYYGALVADARDAGEQLPGDMNATIELATGALFGFALAAYAILDTL